MAAGLQQGRRVLLLEKMEKSGRKVRITGKGRCNVTNARPAEEFASQVRTNAEFFAPAFAFDNRATIRFFERRGVKLEIERGERVFPEERQGVGHRQRPAGLLRRERRRDPLRYACDGHPDPRRPGFRREIHQQAGLRTQGGVPGGDSGHGRGLLSGHGLDGRRLCVCRRPGPHDRTAAAVADAARDVTPPGAAAPPTAAAQHPGNVVDRRRGGPRGVRRTGLPSGASRVPWRCA